MKFLILPTVLGLLILGIALARGGRTALWYGWAAILLFSTKTMFAIQGGFPLTPQTAAFIAIPLGLAIGGGFGPLTRVRWSIFDLLMGAFVAGLTLSNVINGKISTLLIPSMIVLYVVPYVLGAYLSSFRARPGSRIAAALHRTGCAVRSDDF